MSLTFGALRIANALRLPQFKNKHGGLAHSTQDGSDWSPAQWFMAVLGEMGEWARVRLMYESGALTREEYEAKCAKELADIATYLDILARRSLDITEPTPAGWAGAAEHILAAIANVGEYANERKKCERGDITFAELKKHNDKLFAGIYALERLATLDMQQSQASKVVVAHSEGVDLDAAIIAKFNEVSRRVNSDVFMSIGGTPMVRDEDGNMQFESIE